MTYPAAATVSLVTANVTAHGALEVIADNLGGKVWFIQEHHLLPDKLAAVQAGLHATGRKVALCPAAAGAVLGSKKSSVGGVGFVWGPECTCTRPSATLLRGGLQL